MRRGLRICVHIVNDVVRNCGFLGNVIMEFVRNVIVFLKKNIVVVYFLGDEMEKELQRVQETIQWIYFI